MYLITEFDIRPKPKVSLFDCLIAPSITMRYVRTDLVNEGDLSPFILVPPFSSIFDESKRELRDPELLGIIFALEFWRGKSDHRISLCVFLRLEDMDPDIGSVPEKVIDVLWFWSCEPYDLAFDPADDKLFS